MIAYANFYRTILCKQKNTSLRKSNFIPWMIETPKGVNVSLVLFFELYQCRKDMLHVPELIYLL